MLTSLQNSNPTLFLCTVLFIMQAAYGFGSAQHAGNFAILGVLQAIAFNWALSWWFLNDRQQSDLHGHHNYMDMGMFIYVAGMFMIPYYLFRSRGWKAFYTIGLLLAVYLGAFLAGSILYFLIAFF